MPLEDNEEKLIRSVALQNAQAVLLARERAERELVAAKEALERKSEELAVQREFFQVILSSIGEAVIATDTEGRITFLNPVAEAMTGWKLDEAAGQPLENVFKIINEQTRKPAPNPVTTVLREGVVVGLAIHTTLIARDGREIAIADSGAPVRNASGELSGVVMVFHDVTNERKAEHSLHESNQLLSQMRDNLEKRVQERTADLNAANEELSNLSHHLLQMQDEERRRLARELHDSIGQLLSAMGINIGIVQSQSYKLDSSGERAVSENARLVQQVTSEIRTISHLLHPPLLELAGLASALRWYVDGFSERSKIKVSLSIPDDFDRMSDEVELAVFRIVQECLTNIHRHSGSSTAEIRIQPAGSSLLIEILDYGKGISPEKQRELKESGSTGVGFNGMRERLRHLGGTLEVRSDGKGTKVVAILKTSMTHLEVSGMSVGQGKTKDSNES
jgi:PAS domain S-box-containing protein